MYYYFTTRERGVIYDPLQSTAMQIRDKLSHGAIVLFPRARRPPPRRRGRFCVRLLRHPIDRRARAPVTPRRYLYSSLSLRFSPSYIPMYVLSK